MLSYLVLGMLAFVGTSSQIAAAGLEPPLRGSNDATIEGTVLNGTSGMMVTIKTFDNSTTPVTVRYFNTTTNAAGSFTSSVDSDPLILGPYEVEVFRTYYKEVTKPVYSFNESIESGETMTVPHGELEAVDAPIGDLEVTILNGSSGEPLAGVEIDIEHIGNSPDLPAAYPSVNITDQKGSVLYTDLLSVNTSVEASRKNFRDLSSTETDNWVVISEGVTNEISFTLIENPWPFSVNPSDREKNVNVTKDLRINFGRTMDQDSVEDESNYRLYRKEDDQDIPFTAELDLDMESVSLDPVDNLDNNTTYVLTLDTALKTSSGTKPLWRRMIVQFTTELPLAIVSGRLIDAVDSSPIDGVEIDVFETTGVSNSTGGFRISGINPGTNNIQVKESFLYHGFNLRGVEFERGDVLDVGDIELDRKAWGSLNVTVFSDYGHVKDAWISILGSNINVTTGDSGYKIIHPVQAARITLMAGASHHNQVMEQVVIEENSTASLDVTLVEDPLPVIVSPSKELSPRVVRPTTLFNISFDREIKLNSMEVEINLLDDKGDPSDNLDLLPVTVGGISKYIVKPISDLPLESQFELKIDESVQKIDGGKILWRDFVYRFRTPEVPNSTVNGIILLEGRPYSKLNFTLGGEEYGLDEEGVFNITLDMETPSLDLVLRVNGEPYGYEVLYHNFTLESGRDMVLETLSLEPLEGLYSVSPGPGETDVDPGTEIVLDFRDPVASNTSELPDLIEVIPSYSQAPISGSFEISSEGRRVAFKPFSDLSEGDTYKVKVSDRIRFEGDEMYFPVGKESVFTIRPREVDIEMISPETGDLDDMALDGKIRLSFGLSVNRSYLEESMTIIPSPKRKTIVWHSSSEMSIGFFLKSGSGYNLTIPSGRYGTDDELLRKNFHLEFTAGEGYEGRYVESSFNVEPSPDKILSPGQELRLNGIIENGTGMEVLLMIEGEGIDESHTAIVGDDGSWQVIAHLPDVTGSLDLSVSYGIPGEDPVDDPRVWTVDVAEKGDSPEGDEDDSTGVMIAIVIGVLALLIAAVIFLIARKVKSAPADEIDYEDVDIEMEE